MNKILPFLLLSLVFCHVARSQSRYGVKAGANLANQYKKMSIPQVPSTTQDTRNLVGFQVGAFYKIQLQQKLSVSAELNFSVTGSVMTLTTSDGNSHDAHEKLGYIDLPLMLQYEAGKVYFGAGPGFGLKLFAKLTHFESSSYNIPYYQAVDASANLLAGCRVTQKLDINLRYSYGLLNIYKNPGYATAKNRFLNLSLLYTLK